MSQKANKKTLILFDAHAILHRAYHAMPDFATRSGEPTGGLYGLATMLMKIINELKPDYLAACYDRAEETFRKQVYKDYKGTRAKIEDNLLAQLERSREIFAAFHIPVYDQPGFEADDIIGTIVEQTKKDKDLKVIIASGDMDTLQLVDNDRVLVYTLKKGINDTIMYDEKLVKERYGFGPSLLPDYKGLRGDPSDNIIGVKGIGEKTATELITIFGPIEDLYKKLNKSDEPFVKAGFKKRMIELLKANEDEALFSKTLATIRRDASITFKRPTTVWHESFTPVAAEKIFNELEFKSLVARVKNLNRQDNGPTDETNVNEEEAKTEEVSPEIKIAAWLLDSSLTNPTADEVKNLVKAKNLAEAEEKIQLELKRNNLKKVYEEIELPLIPIIAQSKERGILVDTGYLEKLSADYHRQADKLTKKIYKLAGGEFNLNSPKQLGEILFDKLKLNVRGLKKTAGGARSTRESELKKLAGEHKIIDLILDYREFQKLLSTYIDTIPKIVDRERRLHSQLHQAGTTTGRMSSSDPNLQNIPIREGVGMAIRHAFIASPGHEFIAADYSQIELRILALLSGDPELVKIFKEGKDVHAAVASLVFGVPEAEVTREMRRRAKVINFGIIYGMGVNALKINLNSTREEAQKFYDDYFATFPRIKEYFQEVIGEARRRGYSETYFGRRRYFPELKSRLPFLRAAAERMAMNAPLQGTAADVVKLAMIRADKALKEAGLSERVHFLLQIHDELIYEAEDGALKKAEPIIREAMEGVLADKTIPLAVNLSTGTSWAELK